MERPEARVALHEGTVGLIDIPLVIAARPLLTITINTRGFSLPLLVRFIFFFFFCEGDESTVQASLLGTRFCNARAIPLSRLKIGRRFSARTRRVIRQVAALPRSCHLQRRISIFSVGSNLINGPCIAHRRLRDNINNVAAQRCLV